MVDFLILIIIVALLFDISNGWNDSANAIATVVSTKVLSPLAAVSMAAAMNIAGAFLTTAVAKTIGTGIVDPSFINDNLVMAALLSAFAWNTVMTLIGLPVSASHALVGGLVGAAVAHGGTAILNYNGITKILMALLISPFFGILIGFAFMKLIASVFANSVPGRVNKYFGRLQILSSAMMAFGHGSNDAQKVMGIITMALLSRGIITTLEVPTWVILSAALAMGVGTFFGGWKVIKTIGVKMLKLQPVHGFAAETSATFIIVGASALGLPVSTTHVISTAIIGVGATTRLSAVRWGVAGKIVLAWVLTLPVCIGFAWGIMKLIG
ncbi:MAG: inorganic phosphate transporter [Nitrospirae bacterium GWC2_57_13]|jgi:inorganic phosphate transporter, PiT family|nr:MAG: inorganic phosphate transporter [Nitrospirae bacterium GWC1_57_7]OGW27409.1 MAG: inorganic phosphate transporter [Nitrospirae bacterium GWC2_57_13]OGW44811.1 MAG: inorganic phosphate transporter [Nitrospirae bacterium GWD2_57_8]HAS54494.1 anion permease [Nitrospiraceae bacterium]